ncbi:MAG: FAD-binding oxidoreductase [Burkholderiales bacterium]
MKATFEHDLPGLRSRIAGRIVLPQDDGYEEVRRIWNAMIERRPALIVQCAATEDIRQALQFARSHQLEIAVRGAGHNIAGNGTCDDGMMIDLSGLRAVEIDPQARRARVAPGATLADFDAAAQRHGLATPVGVNSTTGIAGLTLGGGFGWLTRRYGMTVDNLLGAEVIGADGTVRSASADEHPDLFWAIRGGGGNFGIVSRFELGLHPVGPEIVAGLVVYPLEQGRDVLRAYREYVASAPESVTAWTVVRAAPPLPFLPESAHGRNAVILAVACTAPIAESEALLAPLKRLGTPLGSHIGAVPYLQWQQAFDPLLQPGARNYWKSHNFELLRDEVIEAMVTCGGERPGPECEIFLAHIAGASNRVPANATAYAHRNARFVMNVHGRWQTQAEDERGIAWARKVFTACAPYASGGVYTNFMTADEADRIEAAYGENHTRLREIKQRYDPDNVFYRNQNIVPAAR